jgi:capsid protein
VWTQAHEERLDEISAALEPLVQKKAQSFSDADCARMNALVNEGQSLLSKKSTHQKAKGMSSYASPAEWGREDCNPGDYDNGGISFKGFGPGMENRIRPTSMYEMDRTQISALKQAAQQGTPFKVQIGSKGIEHGFMGGVRTKAAVTEGGLSPDLLPPVQQLGNRGWFGLPYELTRVANFLPNVAMEGPGVAYFRHDSNGAEAAYTAEGATKPDLTPVIREQYLRPAKVAGRINLTHELVQDAGDAFANHLVTDLARSLCNSESNLLLNGTTGTNGFRRHQPRQRHAHEGGRHRHHRRRCT